MIGKLVVLSGLVAVVLAQASQWPAGLNPAACPNYPNCDNTIVALYGGLPYAAPAAPVGRSYPAGVPAAACPNYPYCGSAAAPAGYVAREYPAGVPAAACPSYPYC